MSLDVYLMGEPQKVPCEHCNGDGSIFQKEDYYWANTTHNLTGMADAAAAAGIYECLWRPEELGIKKAKELIEPLTVGLERLKSDPEHFSKFNAPNGWGTYESFVPWVEKYLHACKEHPDANITVSR